jgi:hypothetical protein
MPHHLGKRLRMAGQVAFADEGLGQRLAVVAAACVRIARAPGPARNFELDHILRTRRRAAPRHVHRSTDPLGDS